MNRSYPVADHPSVEESVQDAQPETVIELYDQELRNIRIVTGPARCAIEVWNPSTNSWWKTDLINTEPNPR